MDAGNDQFNLMLLCWGEGHGSAIHDHADSHCFVKMLYGELTESVFEWPNESDGETGMIRRKKNTIGEDAVTYINGIPPSCFENFSVAQLRDYFFF